MKIKLSLKKLSIWLLIILLSGILIGTASALFLLSLDWVTKTRESNIWIILFLPIAGLAIGFMYHYWGKDVVKGNNQLLEEYENPNKIIPLKMAPLVYLGTIFTHLFGGSAGREGTAVQMGGAIADQFSKYFNLAAEDRKLLIILGISAGFAGVFGAPLAGAVFALEVLVLSQKNIKYIFPSIAIAYLSHYVCLWWNASHTHYTVFSYVEISLSSVSWTIVAGIIFGLAALLFTKLQNIWSSLFSFIKYPPIRPFIGGFFIVLFVFSIQSTKYIGLGIPTIVGAFENPVSQYDFLIKIIITTFTLGAGFKGGEVTPLFFIGATLGNVLIWFIPLPLDVLAAMGFVAVFAGATHTPFACAIMGIELFGLENGFLIFLACLTAYLFSGSKGIYSSQKLGSPKAELYQKFKKNKH